MIACIKNNNHRNTSDNNDNDNTNNNHDKSQFLGTRIKGDQKRGLELSKPENKLLKPHRPLSPLPRYSVLNPSKNRYVNERHSTTLKLK